MADSTNSSIVISAPIAKIMDIIADVENYPDWISGLETVTADEVGEDGRPQAATFHGTIGMIKDWYSVAYDWSQDEVSWHLTGGDKLHGLDGTYACTDRGDGTTKVEYRLSLELAIPVVGLLRRRGEKVIVDSALKGLKKRVENG